LIKINYMKNNVLYYIGRPEVSIGGRFGRRATTYITAMKGQDGIIVFGQQTTLTNGKMTIPKNIIHVSKSEFKKLVSEEDYKKLPK